jgi:hypothetical protein
MVLLHFEIEHEASTFMHLYFTPSEVLRYGEHVSESTRYGSSPIMLLLHSDIEYEAIISMQRYISLSRYCERGNIIHNPVFPDLLAIHAASPSHDRV